MNKKRILILGGNGMLGHKLWQLSRDSMDTIVAVRRPLSDPRFSKLFDPSRLLTGIDAANFDSVIRAVKQVKPAVVVNCIGVVKQRDSAKDPLTCIRINSLFPHQLRELCDTVEARLIHLSTDCIFSGKKGNYSEDDPSDAEDLYGKSKYLGEVDGKGALTIRTSIIGRELENYRSLVEWLLSQNGKRVRGYRRAIYSGFTTIELSRLILSVIQDFHSLSGVYHVSRDPINKYDLVKKLARSFGLQIGIEPYDDFFCDRSLDGSRFKKETSLVFQDFDQMTDELAQDSKLYQNYYRGAL